MKIDLEIRTTMPSGRPPRADAVLRQDREMEKEIVINAEENQHRIAIVEDGRLVELFMESEERERMVGDIYFGQVAKVMPGIKAVFVNVGLEQDAFLHYSDIGDHFREQGNSEAGGGDFVDSGDEPEEGKSGGRRERRSRINLQRGQDIVVQVFKEPVGSKGVRVTTQVSLPGRFLVLMPYENNVGVSRKISNFKERRRLRRIAHSILPPGYGGIIRTVAENKDEDILRADLLSLMQTWREIERTIKKTRNPALIHKDMNAYSSTIRDLFSEDVTRVIVDSRKLYREIRGYVNLVAPHKVDTIKLYEGRTPIFDYTDLEKQIQDSFSSKVWLKSGGYIIIEHTEAMRVIDVNSGRYAKKQEQELNSLKTNIEAAREIARQVRLRDLGGIIVIDYIDMDHEENRRKLLEEMKREMRRDRAKYTILPVSEFGLMQITRQRVRESVQISFTEACPVCHGEGRIQSKAFILTRIDRWLKRFRLTSKEMRLALHVHPALAEYMTAGTLGPLTRMMLRYFVRIKLVPDGALAADEFHFLSRKTNRDITKEHMSS
jgi:ribonuclease G